MSEVSICARRILLLLLSFCLIACNADAPSFHSTDITGAQYGKTAQWTDHTGKPRTLADFKGKAVAVFFGYTQCPDVCPSTLLLLANVAKKLGKDSERLQVVLVTVDPERDTQELLSQYVPAFNPHFLGLRASPAETKKITEDFKVFVRKVGDVTSGQYSVDHSAGIYLYDPQNRLRLFVRPGEKTEEIVADIKILLAGR